MKNDNNYEALKALIKDYKALCAEDIKEKREKGLDTSFNDGEMTAYKMLLEFVDKIENK